MKRFQIGVARACKNLPAVPEKLKISSRVPKKPYFIKKQQNTPVSPKITSRSSNDETDSANNLVKSNYCISEQKRINKLLKVLKKQEQQIASIQVTRDISQNLNDPSGGLFSNTQKFSDSEEVAKKTDPENLKKINREKEVKKLEAELEDSKLLIECLKKKKDKYSSKLIRHSSELEKIRSFEKTLRELNTDFELDIMSLRKQIDQKTSKSKLNQIQIEELCEQLKKNEEKRLIINKFSSHIDVQIKIMNDKITEIDQEKHGISIEVEDTRNKIKQEDQTISRLLSSLKGLNKKDCEMREANFDLNFKFEAVKDELEKLQKNSDFLKSEFEFEMKNLEETLKQQEKKPEEKVLIRRATVNNRLNDFADFETENLQSACLYVQRQLDLAKEALNKLKKNEEYLNTQYSVKEAKIQQMEKIISVRKTQPKTREFNEVLTKRYSGLKDVMDVIEEVKLNLSHAQNSIFCVSCYTVPDFIYILSPCTHIYCPACRSSLQNFCMKCAVSYKNIITPEAINKILHYFQVIAEGVNKLRKQLSIEHLKLNQR